MSAFRAAGRRAADLFIDGLSLATRLLIPIDIDARVSRAAEERQRMRLVDDEVENEVHEPANTSARPTSPGVAEERPAPADYPTAGAGPTRHTDAELITAAANQVDVLRRLITNPTKLQHCSFHISYLDELIPQLRDLAVQYEAAE